MVTAMTTRPLLTLITCFLAGCSGASNVHPDPAYGRLILHQAVTIPAGAATLRLQYGRATASNAVQEQDPFCIFEIETVSATPQSVPPGSFPITDISRSATAFSGMPALGFAPSFRNDDGPSQIYYKTVFRLADAHGSVRALACMSNQNTSGNAPFMRHLTPAEIRGALGQDFTLELHGR